MRIYENVKRLAKEKKTNVLAIEKRLGFSRGSIFKWDNSVPSVSKVAAVAKLLEVPIEDLIGDDAKKDSETNVAQT